MLLRAGTWFRPPPIAVSLWLRWRESKPQEKGTFEAFSLAVSLNEPPPLSTCNQPLKHGLTLWDRSPWEGVPLPLPISSEASGASDEILISPLIGNCAAVVTRAAAKPSISIRSISA